MTRVVACAKCGEVKYVKGRGLCSSCYEYEHRTGNLGRWKLTQTGRARREDVAELARRGMSTSAIAKHLGISVNAASLHVVRARAAGDLDRVAPERLPWPDEPSPCKYADPDLFLHYSSNGKPNAWDRERTADALSYCDRCPPSTRQWCIESVDPVASQFSGVAGGIVWVKGQPREVLAGDAEQAAS